VNRDSSQQVKLSIKDLGISGATVLRLTAPSADSKTGVTFGGSQVSATGHWSAAKKERVHDGVLTVPAMSAVVARA
jgi:hypothetical protein